MLRMTFVSQIPEAMLPLKHMTDGPRDRSAVQGAAQLRARQPSGSSRGVAQR
jgi:hypothetical protein